MYFKYFDYRSLNSQQIKNVKKLMKINNTVISESKSRLHIRQVLFVHVNVEQRERYWVITFLIGSANDSEARRGCLTIWLA